MPFPSQPCEVRKFTTNVKKRCSTNKRGATKKIKNAFELEKGATLRSQKVLKFLKYKKCIYSCLIYNFYLQKFWWSVSQMSKQGIRMLCWLVRACKFTNTTGKKREFPPFSKGSNLPKFQVFLGHPGFDHNRPCLLSRFWLLWSQSTWTKAFPLRCRSLCSKEWWTDQISTVFLVSQALHYRRHSMSENKGLPGIRTLWVTITFGSLRHPKGTNDLPDAILWTNAIRTNISPLDDLSGGDISVRCLCLVTQKWLSIGFLKFFMNAKVILKWLSANLFALSLLWVRVSQTYHPIWGRPKVTVALGSLQPKTSPSGVGIWIKETSSSLASRKLFLKMRYSCRSHRPIWSFGD